MHFSAAAVWMLLIVATARAAEAPTATDVSTPAVHPNKSDEAVARELLEIQQRLGGSVVAGSDVLQAIPASDKSLLTGSVPGSPLETPLNIGPVNPAIQQGLASSPAGRIQSLRDAAWQIDRSAELLERSDLFQQADELRDLARQFRSEARTIRTQSAEKNPVPHKSATKHRPVVR